MTRARIVRNLAACLIAPLLLAAEPSTRAVVHKAKDPAHLKLAIVTNNASDYWALAKAGSDRFAAEAGIPIDFKMPADGKTSEQIAIVRQLMADGCDGVAVSVVDPTNEGPALAKLASDSNLVGFDSDCPAAHPAVSVITDNVAAGRMVGKRLIELLPDGGKAAVFCGLFQAKNATERMDGIKQAIAGHAIDLITEEDYKDRARVLELANDVLTKQPDVKVLVGIWSYDGPAIAEAVQGAHKESDVKVLAFDQEQATLEAVRSGVIDSAFVSQPDVIGYRTAKYLHDMAVDGDAAKLPANGVEIVDMLRIDKAGVDAYEKKLNDLREAAKR
jgi:ribose transport system substrate-binding protein